jgi:hypothetical protein
MTKLIGYGQPVLAMHLRHSDHSILTALGLLEAIWSRPQVALFLGKGWARIS